MSRRESCTDSSSWRTPPSLSPCWSQQATSAWWVSVSLGCSSTASSKLRDRLVVLLPFEIDLPERLADDRVVQAGLGALLVQCGDVGVEVGRLAKDLLERFQRLVAVDRAAAPN